MILFYGGNFQMKLCESIKDRKTYQNSTWKKLRSKQGLHLKRHSKKYKSCARPVLLYCSETQYLNVVDEQRLRGVEWHMIRKHVGDKTDRSESQVMFSKKGSVLLSRSWTSQCTALCDGMVMSPIDTFSNTRSRETEDWRKNKKRSSKTIGLMLKIAKDDKARLKRKLLTQAVWDNGVKTDVAVVVVVYP